MSLHSRQLGPVLSQINWTDTAWTCTVTNHWLVVGWQLNLHSLKCTATKKYVQLDQAMV